MTAPSLDASAAPRTRLSSSAATDVLPLGLVVLAFLPTWLSFPASWAERGLHGYVVAAFCGWLIWQRRERLQQREEAVGLATVAILGATMLWLIAWVLNVQVVQQGVVPVILFLWLLASRGAGATRAAAPILAIFMLAVPIWGSFTRLLQSMTVAVNGLLLGVTGVPGRIEGDLIILPSGVLWVAEGCSGLGFLETGLLVGAVYAMLFLVRWEARVLAVAIAGALAIVSNWIRVFGIAVVAHQSNMQSSLVNDHELYGWVIFCLVLVTFFAFGRRIERWDRKLSRQYEHAVAAKAATGASTRGAASPPARARWRVDAPPTVAAVAGPALFFVFAAMPTTSELPGNVPGIAPGEGWVRETSTQVAAVGRPGPRDSLPTDSDEWHPAFSGADDHVVETWRRDGTTVQVDHLIYRTQRQGKELINDENRIAPSRFVAGRGLIGPLDADGRMVNATGVRTNPSGRLVWSWYRVGGHATHSDIEAKLFELVSFFSRRTGSELVTVSTLCNATDCNAAMQTLSTFVTGQPLGASR